MIFLNNYDLNYGHELWDEPEQFIPERFLHDGVIVKPDHFFPFSTGRRSCMGYKMVQLQSHSLTSKVLQNYRIEPVDGYSYDVPVGDLALPFNSYKFKFIEDKVSL